MFLRRESAPIAQRARPRIATVCAEWARSARVREIGGQNLVADALVMLRVLQRKQHFHTFIEVSRHPVRASQIKIGLPSVFEVKNPAVLQKPSDHAAHANTAA